MKATLLLQKDHEKLRGLFDKFRASKPTVRHAVFEQIRKEITIHSSIETELFYPEIQNSSSDRGAELVADAMGEHQSVDKQLEEISSLSADDPRFQAKMTRLMEDVDRHVAVEEAEIFAEARSYFSEQKLEELGLDMEMRKSILTQIAA